MGPCGGMSRRNLSAFSDIDEVLEATGPDALSLATSARTLKQALSAALRHGSGRPQHGAWSRTLVQLRAFMARASPLVPQGCTALERLSSFLAENADVLAERLLQPNQAQTDGDDHPPGDNLVGTAS